MNMKQNTYHKIIIGDSRDMKEIDDSTVHLIVTSPPYPMIEMWDNLFRKLDPTIDDLWNEFQNTNRQTEAEKITMKIYKRMHKNLSKVWNECYRVLIDGGIACINIGDATRKINNLFRLFPNHSKVIEHCEKIGFITLPYILWKKPTTKPTYKGKGAFLGSGFLPTNAYVTLDCEFILIFRKGDLRKFEPNDELRYRSKYTKEERDIWFSQIWNIRGERQNGFASYPEELPYRLIRMFSIIGDTVLDPFLGTGTTTLAAVKLNRNSIGYEIKSEALSIIKEKIDIAQKRLDTYTKFEILERKKTRTY